MPYGPRSTLRTLRTLPEAVTFTRVKASSNVMVDGAWYVMGGWPVSDGDVSQVKHAHHRSWRSTV
jgi:hypothetical protein